MTDNANALYQEVGLPLVTPGEHGDFTQSLESLAAPEIIHESIMAKAVNLSEETLMNTVHYINLNPTSSAGLQTQLDAVANNIKLSNNFFIAKANSALDARVDAKQLSHDEVKMANYRVKVMNHLAINTPWFSTNSMQTQRKIFTMKKEDFHLELIKTFTEGMNLPLSSIAAKLENFLTNVNNIINSQTKSSDESLMFFISITSYQLDDVERWQPYTRTIYFKVDQSLSKYIKEKKNTSSDTKLNVEFEYLQTDSLFNNELFESNAKKAIQHFSEAGMGDLVSGCTTYDIPVDI